MPSLKQYYNCYGDFYIWNGQECRRRLDIILKGASATVPDFMVVMMNPGSSKPLNPPPHHGYVLADPDPTQDKIMELMHHAGYEYARILNLSDLCEGNSEKFRKLLTQVAPNTDHSIFDANRTSDFKKLWVSRVPVLAAWGVHSKLEPLAKSAQAAIGHEDVRGNDKPHSAWAYYHPKPSLHVDQAKWMKDIKLKF